MRKGHLRFVILVCVFTEHRVAADTDQAILEQLQNRGVRVEYAAPLKQIWLEPENGMTPPAKPLRLWFHPPWKPRFEDIESLPKLPQLYGVSFGAVEIDERWLRALGKTPQLREVILNGPGFTDESLKHIAYLRELDSLTLSATRVTDKGMFRLRDLSSLEFLSLAGSEGITDMGFQYLYVKNLRICDF